MRPSIALLTFAITLLGSSSASACCLTDWLFGRTPYVAGYAPYAYSAGYAPVVTPYQANYPVATTTSILSPTATGPAPALPAPALTSGVYQAQRPTYFNNPSVYTGAPVTSVYGANRVPVATYYRGSPASNSSYTANSYLGATNQYPNNDSSGTYSSGYGSAPVAVQTTPGLPLTTAAPVGTPSYAVPATPTAPLFAPTPPQPSGLSRFFGSMFGTNYRSAYYRAPITYYRPATSVDPVTGTTVTVQQPCSSYVQQLQRTPYTSLQAPASPLIAPTSPTCSTTTAPSAYGATTYGSPGTGGIGQASAMTSPTPGQFTVPIPSTMPGQPSSGYGQSGSTNSAPLTGPPPGSYAPQASSSPYANQPSHYGGAPPTGAPSAGDRSPVDQPELRNRPPASSNGSENGGRNEPQSEQRPAPQSYWELQDAEDSTAMISKSQQYDTRWSQSPAQPIVAPEDYVSPFRRQLESATKPVNRSTFEAPPLPPRSQNRITPSAESNWVSAPVREASATRQRFERSNRSTNLHRPVTRDTTWKPARNRP